MSGNPQIEDGFVRVATELQRELCRFRIPGEARQVLDAIILKTYGFNKKEDAISLSQLSGLTGLATSDVCRALRKLQQMNIIGKKASTTISVWYVNKRYSTWKALAKKPVADTPVAKKTKGTGESANQALAKKPDTINTLTKDNIQKTPSPSEKGPRPSVESVIATMRDCFGTLDDSDKKNRRYAWLLIQKAMKSGEDESRAAEMCVILIRAASQHEWWRSRITKVETVYRNANLIAKAVREQRTQVVFIS